MKIRFPYKTPIDYYDGDIINITSDHGSETIEAVLLVHFLPACDNDIFPVDFKELWSLEDSSGVDYSNKLFTDKCEVVGNMFDISKKVQKRKGL